MRDRHAPDGEPRLLADRDARRRRDHRDPGGDGDAADRPVLPQLQDPRGPAIRSPRPSSPHARRAISKNVNIGVSFVIESPTRYWVHVEDDLSAAHARPRAGPRLRGARPVQSTRDGSAEGGPRSRTDVGGRVPEGRHRPDDVGAGLLAPNGGWFRFNRLGGRCTDVGCPANSRRRSPPSTPGAAERRQRQPDLRVPDDHGAQSRPAGEPGRTRSDHEMREDDMNRATRVARRTEAGFTLIEALVAIIILSFGLIAVTNLMLVAASSNTVANQGTAAAAIATRADGSGSRRCRSSTPVSPRRGHRCRRRLWDGLWTPSPASAIPASTRATCRSTAWARIRVRWRIDDIVASRGSDLSSCRPGSSSSPSEPRAWGR